MIEIDILAPHDDASIRELGKSLGREMALKREEAFIDTLMVPKPKMRARPCPVCHSYDTTIYSVHGEVRYHKCGTCGRTYKVAGKAGQR